MSNRMLGKLLIKFLERDNCDIDHKKNKSSYRNANNLSLLINKLKIKCYILSLILSIFIIIIKQNNYIIAYNNNNNNNNFSYHLQMINNDIISLSLRRQQVFILEVSHSNTNTKQILRQRCLVLARLILNLEQQKKIIQELITEGIDNNQKIDQLLELKRHFINQSMLI
ncbi:MAG: hypothetical protein Q8875_01895 [Pigeon pea little leaf phytoplasma]|uniref:Transmembrane protein n=1 Tax=Candidatus Phytoplasma fabacearum TaxID=2982628 RepID=A0ABU8ZT77_9MOLU|nr:hypothetical protein [Pigeon pea little leaf phytoplasma]MDV3196886.1 hypothetical protein [Pigeon pea little leaf phytoplasma]MDV3200373.1 hypothetical protein [Pigeon pea little leaf phytoplasma]